MEKTSPSRALFVKDIPQNISYHEFEDLFKLLPGFLTMRRKPHFAFIEFRDTEFATMAMIKYQGHVFSSAEKPILIDYDKDRSKDINDEKREYRDFRDNRNHRDGGRDFRDFRDHRDYGNRDNGSRDGGRDFRDHRDSVNRDYGRDNYNRIKNNRDSYNGYSHNNDRDHHYSNNNNHHHHHHNNNNHHNNHHNYNHHYNNHRDNNSDLRFSDIRDSDYNSKKRLKGEEDQRNERDERDERDERNDRERIEREERERYERERSERDRGSHNSDHNEDNGDHDRNKANTSSSSTTAKSPNSLKRYRHEDNSYRPLYDRYSSEKFYNSSALSNYRDHHINGYQSHLNTPTHSSGNSPLLPSFIAHPYGTSTTSLNKGNNSPCPTLFVSNLPKDVTERELLILFRFMAGFLGIRLIHKEGKLPMCFCDFVDTSSATFALDFLQGFRMDPKDISSSISIEFDKANNNNNNNDNKNNDNDSIIKK